MTDEVIESFIKARKNKGRIMLYVLIFAVTMLIDVVIFMFFWLIGFYLSIIITGLAAVLVIILMRRGKLEYELSIVKGEMTVSEIRNQAMRKRLLSFDIKDIENFRETNLEEIASLDPKYNRENPHRLLYCISDDPEAIYFFTARAKEEGVTYDIYMSPDDRILKEIASKNFGAKRVLSGRLAVAAGQNQEES